MPLRNPVNPGKPAPKTIQRQPSTNSTNTFAGKSQKPKDAAQANDAEHTCVKCTQSVNPNDSAVQCDDCERWQHFKCTNLKRASYAALRDDPSDHIGFFCTACVTKRRRNRLTEQRPSSCSTVRVDASSEGAGIASVIKEPSPIIVSPPPPSFAAASGLPQPAQTFGSLVSGAPSKPRSATKVESLTVICSNVPEASSPCFKTRQTADLNQWDDLCSNLSVSVVPENLVRLSRPADSPHSGKPRLLRVSLKSVADTESILLSAHRLRLTSSDIRIYADTPWSERQARRKDTFDRRSEVNKRSVFIHGVPELDDPDDCKKVAHDRDQWNFVQTQSKIHDCLATDLQRIPFSPAYKGSGPRILKVTFHSIDMVQYALDAWYQNRRYLPTEIRLRPAFDGRSAGHSSRPKAPVQPPCSTETCSIDPKKRTPADPCGVGELSDHPPAAPSTIRSNLHRTALNCFYTNAQGLLGKIPELRLHHASRTMDLIAVTETWLMSSVTDAELSLPGMHVIRQDRVSRGGGVLLYYNSNLLCEPISTPGLSHPDTLWCRLRLCNRDSALLAVIYRPPSSPQSDDERLMHSLRQALSLRHSHVLIMGDFNVPNLMHPPTSGCFTANFADMLVTHPLYNHVSNPTRFRGSDTPSMLDLIITNEELMVEEIRTCPPLGSSDHVVLLFQYVCYAFYPDDVPTGVRTVVDYARFRELFALNPWEFLVSDTLQSAWDRFLSQWHCLLHLATVSKPVNVKSPSSFIRSRTRKFLAQRNQAWFDFKLHPSISNWESFRSLRNHCTSLVRQDKADRQSYLTEQFVSNRKLLYRHINNKRKVATGIPSIQTPNGYTTTSVETANALREQYIQIFEEGEALEPTSPLSTSSSPTLTTVLFTPNIVHAKINKIRENSSPGIDSIHPKALRCVADLISEPLAIYFQRLLDSSTIPQAWKQGIISPVFKGGSRSLAENYRPVTLLPVISKLMESVIADALATHLQNTQQLAPTQHGFRRSRSCTTNLLVARDQWTQAVDKGVGVDVVYLDFSKAFDRVDHRILLQKLSTSGIADPLLGWFASFLCSRSLRVRVRNSYSEVISVNCGVPQGSVLGPHLFTVFINDIGRLLQSPYLLFADDVKIWRVLQSPDDTRVLQADLNELCAWSVSNRLPFNVSKCRTLHIRHGRCHSYKLGETDICESAEETDLGVVVQSDLGCSVQCGRAATSANRTLSLLKRALGTFDPSLLPCLLNSFIRPYTEYGVAVWNPWLARDIHLLEQPQRRATKHVRGLYHVPYSDRLQRLGVYSAKFRRIRGDLILVYRILQDESHPCRYLLSVSDRASSRGHQLKLRHQHSQLNCRHNFFSLRVCHIWNSLPCDVVRATSLSTFKLRLDLALASLLYEL